MRRLALFCLLLPLPFLGLGCKEPDYTRGKAENWRGVIQDTAKPSTPQKPSTPPPPARRKGFDTETPTAPEVFLLRQALTNLSSANSFRATLTLPAAEGETNPVKGELLFNRDRGFRGTIRINPELQSEVFVINEEVYFRANTTTWENITQRPEGARLRAFFSIAFPGDKDTKATRISEKARILEVTEDAGGACRRYVYTEIVPTGDVEKTVLCVKDNLPVYIQNEYAEGNTEVRYSDVNQPIDLGSLN